MLWLTLAQETRRGLTKALHCLVLLTQRRKRKRKKRKRLSKGFDYVTNFCLLYVLLWYVFYFIYMYIDINDGVWYITCAEVTLEEKSPVCIKTLSVVPVCLKTLSPFCVVCQLIPIWPWSQRLRVQSGGDGRHRRGTLLVLHRGMGSHRRTELFYMMKIV